MIHPWRFATLLLGGGVASVIFGQVVRFSLASGVFVFAAAFMVGYAVRPWLYGPDEPPP